MRFWARIDFRLYGGMHSKMEWDTDNLLKAFFDALADSGFFGGPAHRWVVDERRRARGLSTGP